jgi:hypothetical protein
VGDGGGLGWAGVGLPRVKGGGYLRVVVKVALEVLSLDEP